MPHAFNKAQLVEQPAIGLFGELGWPAVPALEWLNLAPRPDAMTVATISLERPVSPRGGNPLYGETVAVRRRAALIEWLTEFRCKYLISSKFLFE